MNVFMLLQRASKRLELQDALFHEQSDIVLAMLRSACVLPYKRSSLNGHLHQLFAAMIVEAYDADTSVDITTRKAETFHKFGYSTKVVSYADKAVEQGFLLSERDKAKGKLTLSYLLEGYLAEAQLMQA